MKARPALQEPELAESTPAKAWLETAAPLFVSTVWVTALAAMLALAFFYTVNIPWADEWDYAPALAGDWPISFQLLWQQHNEHRIPLPKLIWFASLRVSGNNFRLLGFVNILAFAGLAAALVIAARKVRGRTSFTDAFFPLMVLSPAHYQNMLWAWQIAFTLAVLLAGALLLIIIKSAVSAPSLGWRSVVAGSVCLILLPLSGAVGLVFAPALAVWWACLAVCDLRDPPLQKRKTLLLLGTICFVVFLVIMYLHGLQRPPQIPVSPGVVASLRTTIEFFAGSFGYDAGLKWPWTGWAVAALLAGSMVAVLVAIRGGARRRAPVTGFFLFLCASAALALGIGWGRAGLGVGAGLQPRYVTLMLPALVCIYFVWQLYAPPSVHRAVQIALFAGAAILLPTSMREAVAFRELRVQQMDAFKADLLKGMTPVALVQHHAALLDHFADAPEQGAEAMQLMARAGVDVFRTINNASVPGKPIQPGGSLDIVSDDLIGGWAWDEKNPDKHLKVEIYDGATLLTAVDAGIFRPDLLQAKIGTGQYAFLYVPPAFLLDGRPHTIHAVVKDAGFELPASPKTLLGTREVKFLASPSPVNSGGTLDLVDENRIEGWAWDSSSANAHVRVTILDGQTVLGTAEAILFRPDLLDAHIGRGDHAFVFHLSSQLRDGKPHTIRAIIDGSNVELPGSPKHFTAKR